MSNNLLTTTGWMTGVIFLSFALCVVTAFVGRNWTHHLIFHISSIKQLRTIWQPS